MDALDVIKVCLRRWYVMLPIVMMALGAGYALAKDQRPSYHARATFAFVYQNASTLPGGADPRLANPLASSDLLGAALGYSLATPETQERLGAPTASGLPLGTSSNGLRFAFAGQSFTYGVDSWAPTSGAAETTVENVMAAIPDEVKRLQQSAGAPAGSLSTIFVMSPTRVDVIPPGSGIKTLIAVGGAGVVTGAALSVAIDAILRRRTRRGGGRQAPPRDALAGDAGDDEESTPRPKERQVRHAARPSGDPSEAAQPISDGTTGPASEEPRVAGPTVAAGPAPEEDSGADEERVSRSDGSSEQSGTIISLVGGHGARRSGSTRVETRSS